MRGVAERFWILTAFFNPVPSARRLQNYRRFRERTGGGHCGFAGCGRREILTRHGFYDRGIPRPLARVVEWLKWRMPPVWRALRWCWKHAASPGAPRPSR